MKVSLIKECDRDIPTATTIAEPALVQAFKRYTPSRLRGTGQPRGVSVLLDVVVIVAISGFHGYGGVSSSPASSVSSKPSTCL